MSYIGRTGKLSQRAYNKVSFLATAGQTIKTGLSYVAGFVEVHVNGLLLTDTVDYTATNGNSVTFVLALNVDDEVTVISLKTFAAADMLPLSGGTVAGDLGVSGGAIVDGNLLVGKSVIGLAADGFEARTNGITIASNTNDTPFSVNRSGTDGMLINLYKSGVTFGSIGSATSGYSLYINAGDVGLKLEPLADDIKPCTSNGATRDGAIDLGDSAARFKDLYLSGGVVFGTPSGSVTSNTLDDYEEGTWTPSIEGSTTAGTYNYGQQEGYYTKIGDLVTIIGIIYGNAGSGAGNLQLVDLPFTMRHSHTGHGSFQVNGSMPFPEGTVGYHFVQDMTGSNLKMYVRCTLNNATLQYVAYPTTVNYMRFNMQYHTDS